MMSHKEKELFTGLMDKDTKGCGHLVKNMGKAKYFFKTEAIIKDNSTPIKFMALGFTIGKMRRNMKGIGSIIKNVAQENLFGKMGMSTKGYLTMENIMDME